MELFKKKADKYCFKPDFDYKIEIHISINEKGEVGCHLLES